MSLICCRTYVEQLSRGCKFALWRSQIRLCGVAAEEKIEHRYETINLGQSQWQR